MLVGCASGRVEWEQVTYDSEDPVDPAVSNIVRDESEDEGSEWYTNGNKQCPDAHVTCSFFLEKGLGDNTAANRTGRTDEEGYNGTACCH